MSTLSEAVSHSENVGLLHTVLLNHAPSLDAETVCDKILFDALTGDKISLADAEKLLVSILQDGLAFGNWPWLR